MAATDARPVPRKNTAFRVTFPILDADGDPVTAAATLDSEVSIDGGTFADVTAEATEIATGSGVYFLDLTAAEMNGDTVAIIVKTSTVGAKTTVIVLYPEDAGDYRASVVSGGITAASFAAGAIDAAAIGTGAIDADALAADAITAAKVAADVSAEIADQVWDEAKAGHVGAGSMGEEIQAHATPAEVNAEVLDVFNVDTFAEPSGVPAATSTIFDRIRWLGALAHNKITQSSSTQVLRNDADSGNIATAAVADDGTNGSRAEWV